MLQNHTFYLVVIELFRIEILKEIIQKGFSLLFGQPLFFQLQSNETNMIKFVYSCNVQNCATSVRKQLAYENKSPTDFSSYSSYQHLGFRATNAPEENRCNKD